MDTSKLKQEIKFQEQLLHNYEFYKIAFELSRDPKLVLEDCVITRFNLATMKIFDCDDPHLLYMHKFTEFLPSEFLEKGLIDKKCSGNLMIETEIRTCRGQWKNVSISFDLLEKNGTNRIIVTIYDISDRIKVKRELDNINDFVLSFMQNLPVGVAIYNFSSKMLKYSNNKFLTITGLNVLDAKNFLHLFQLLNLKKEQELEAFDKIIKLFETEHFIHCDNVKILDNFGEEQVLDVNLFAIKEQDLIILIIKDITKEYREQKWLKLKHEIIKNLPNPIIVTNAEGKILWVNEEFVKFYGYNKEEVLGKTPNVLKSNRHDKEFFESLWSTIISGKIWSSEIVNKRKDGELVVDNQIIIPIRLEDKEITHFVAIQNLTKEELDYLTK